MVTPEFSETAPVDNTPAGPALDPEYLAWKKDKDDKAAAEQAKADKAAHANKPESKLAEYEKDLRAWFDHVGRSISIVPPVHPDDVPEDAPAV